MTPRRPPKYYYEAQKTINFAIKEIKKMFAANNGEGVAHYSAFILASCVIDYLAGYCYAGHGYGYGEKYRKFVKEHLKRVDSRYDPSAFWKNLRCGLVHGFSDKKKGTPGKFYFTHKHPKHHLTVQTYSPEFGPRTVLDIKRLVKDIIMAKKIFFRKALTSPVILKSIEKRRKEVGVFRPDIP